LPEKLTKRSDDYAKWYTELIQRAELADYAPVKGCMVFRPHGFALWESIKSVLDGMIKATGHKNVYFPMLIPESLFKKEQQHVDGFAPECAVVTHGGGKKLDEPLYLRPTSETIIWTMASKWISSYRDLPFLINQWANIVRWEMRPRLFLRTTEFLWQEGHTAHATPEEAHEETLTMLSLYRKLLESYLAIPVCVGRKTELEKFAGAEQTYSVEAMTQDKRAIQAGTSHYFGDRFARAFDVKFQDRDGQLRHVSTSSWGVSSRIIGTLIMVHGDDQGLVLPPRIAPIQVVIVPIWKSDEQRQAVMNVADNVKETLDAKFSVEVDTREGYSPGWKFNEWELRGIPVRVEIGPRDVENRQVVLARRDSGEKSSVAQETVVKAVAEMLQDVHISLFKRAKEFMEANSHRIDSYEEFKSLIEESGGFVYAHWCGDGACELAVKEETKATIRCIPLDGEPESGSCIYCGKPSKERVVFAKAY